MAALDKFAAACRAAADEFAAATAESLAVAAGAANFAESLEAACDRLDIAHRDGKVYFLMRIGSFGAATVFDEEWVNFAPNEVPVAVSNIHMNENDFAAILTNYGRIVAGIRYPYDEKRMKQKTYALRKLPNGNGCREPPNCNPIGPIILPSRAVVHAFPEYAKFCFSELSNRYRWKPNAETQLFEFITGGSTSVETDYLQATIAKHEAQITELRTATEAARAAAEAARVSELAHKTAEQKLAQQTSENDAMVAARLQDIDVRETQFRADRDGIAERLNRIRQRENALALQESISDAQIRCKLMAEKLTELHDVLDIDPVAIRTMAGELRKLANSVITDEVRSQTAAHRQQNQIPIKTHPLPPTSIGHPRR
jgi:hypothetical protein